MTGKILGAYKQRIKEFKLVPSSGGCFELTANGELLYSKLKTGEFPDENAVADMLEQRLKK